MKCFAHNEHDAVGTCKSCGKGLCAACAVDLGKGLACKARCEADVRKLIALIDNNIEISAKSITVTRNMRKNSFVLAAFVGAMGVICLLMDLLSTHPTYVIGAFGVVFLAYSGFVCWRGITLPK